MTIAVDYATPDRVVARLCERDVETTVSAWGPQTAASALLEAIQAAETDGYGECFWPESTGQYWWMLRRSGARVEVVVLWSSGAVTGWQHVFRADEDLERFSRQAREALVP